MKKTDATYLEWLKGVRFKHEINDENPSIWIHNFIVTLENGKIIKDGDYNPVIAVKKLAVKLKEYYFKEVNIKELEKKAKEKKEKDKKEREEIIKTIYDNN